MDICGLKSRFNIWHTSNLTFVMRRPVVSGPILKWALLPKYASSDQCRASLGFRLRTSKLKMGNQIGGWKTFPFQPNTSFITWGAKKYSILAWLYIFWHSIYKDNPSKPIQFTDSPYSKYIFEFVFFVMCLYCIIVKLGIKVIISIIIICQEN